MGVYRKRWIGLSERNEESHLSSDVLGSRIHPKQGLQTKKALLDDAARSFQLNGAHHCPAFVAFGVLSRDWRVAWQHSLAQKRLEKLCTGKNAMWQNILGPWPRGADLSRRCGLDRVLSPTLLQAVTATTGAHIAATAASARTVPCATPSPVPACAPQASVAGAAKISAHLAPTARAASCRASAAMVPVATPARASVSVHLATRESSE